MHHHLILRHFKVKPPVRRPKPVKRFSIPRDFSKALIIQVLQILLRHLEFIQQLKLFQSTQLRNFSRTDFIKNDL